MAPLDIKYLVAHCSATDKNKKFADIRQMHLDKGWSDVGYHMVIETDGTKKLGRSLSRQGAHVKGLNAVSWGVCLIGGVDADGTPVDNFNRIQLISLAEVFTAWLGLAPQAEVLGHRDLFPDYNGDGVIDSRDWLKECPCFDVKPWWAAQHE